MQRLHVLGIEGFYDALQHLLCVGSVVNQTHQLFDLALQRCLVEQDVELEVGLFESAHRLVLLGSHFLEIRVELFLRVKALFQLQAEQYGQLLLQGGGLHQFQLGHHGVFEVRTHVVAQKLVEPLQLFGC